MAAYHCVSMAGLALHSLWREGERGGRRRGRKMEGEKGRERERRREEGRKGEGREQGERKGEFNNTVFHNSGHNCSPHNFCNVQT